MVPGDAGEPTCLVQRGVSLPPVVGAPLVDALSNPTQGTHEGCLYDYTSMLSSASTWRRAESRMSQALRRLPRRSQ